MWRGRHGGHRCPTCRVACRSEPVACVALDAACAALAAASEGGGAEAYTSRTRAGREAKAAAADADDHAGVGGFPGHGARARLAPRGVH